MMTEAWPHNAVEIRKMFRLFRLVMVLAAFPAAAAAQGSAIINPVYRRAQGLVNDGNVIAGRALVDSMLSVAPPGSNDYAEGVYWRAVLASTASDAEMDYRRIVVDYPRSPRVEDALVRLAQLEIARANYDGALKHLNTLITDHPESASRGRAGYWMARALFDKNDVQGGCAATADALTRTSEDDTELRNQITYLNQRCAGVVLGGPSGSTETSPQNIATPKQADSVAKAPDKPPVNPQVTTEPPVTTPAVVSNPAPAPAPPAKKTTPAEKPASSESTTDGGSYSVQVAAYNVKSQAAAMAAKLKQRGYEARVDGVKAPFRVRIGKYATQAQANAVQRSLKAKQITGFVVQADTQ